MEIKLSLKEYQQGAYRTEKAELEEVFCLIKRVLPLYRHAFINEYWPYVASHLTPLKPCAPENYSASTNAMIMVMLSSIKEKIGFACEEKEIEENIKSAKKKYFDYVFGKIEFRNKSNSYGSNDPLNLYWAYKLCKEDEKKLLLASVSNAIESRLYKEKYPRELNSLLNFEDKTVDQQEHSFIALYAYRCAICANACEGITEKYYNFFELRLHQHLSFNSIPDSRFDPAELVFCLEGMLLSKPSSVSEEILHRVFSVLGEAQNTTPCWRPVNPVYATPQGQIFLPLSIEVGMSLLNIFKSIDNDSRPQSYFAKYLPMLQRYFKWLKAQEKTISFVAANKKIYVSGWESEHVGNEGVIHIWQTALILDYLASYAKLLKRHIAKQYLICSGLSVEYSHDVEKCKKCFFENSNPFYDFNCSDFRYNVPRYVFKNFIAKQKNNDEGFNCCCSEEIKSDVASESLYSLLLYGPPGTGKSFFTKKIAQCLNWKHITITPSDFLANGSAEIEVRAKGIFSCLMEQENAVILFDEIDQFILDRDSKRYDAQSDVFKLLTPGMLPKFQELRENAKCIFVIATNYAERIDPAIVRLGRIDIKIPLLPPDWKKRKAICLDFFDELREKGKLKSEYTDSDCDIIADHTPLSSWKELTTLLKKVSAEKQNDGLDKFVIDNCAINLTFEKVLQRLDKLSAESVEKLNDKKSAYSASDGIIEELALMCIVYDKDVATGKKVFEKVFDGFSTIISDVESKISDLIK